MPSAPWLDEEETKRRRAALPETEWEVVENRRLMPSDLQEIVGADSDVLRSGEHLWRVHQPPHPGAKLNKQGDAREEELGKHFSARRYFDELEQRLSQWEYQGRSPADKTPKGQTSWEVYSPVENGLYLLTIITQQHHTGQHEIASSYLVGRATVENRVKKGYLTKRK
ncbi:hypothetical protein BH09CHL1_BH09CHL1_04360 [soil metagenome]